MAWHGVMECRWNEKSIMNNEGTTESPKGRIEAPHHFCKTQINAIFSKPNTFINNHTPARSRSQSPIFSGVSSSTTSSTPLSSLSLSCTCRLPICPAVNIRSRGKHGWGCSRRPQTGCVVVPEHIACFFAVFWVTKLRKQ